MPSINLDLDYFDNPKTMHLTSLLGKGAEVLPIRVWCYCGKHYAETGRLTGLSTDTVEQIAGWRGPKGKAVEAMLTAGFLTKDEESGYFQIPNWLEHAGHIAAYHKKGKEMAQKRYASSAASTAASNADSSAASSADSNAASTARAEQNRTKTTTAPARAFVRHAGARIHNTDNYREVDSRGKPWPLPWNPKTWTPAMLEEYVRLNDGFSPRGYSVTLDPAMQ